MLISSSNNLKREAEVIEKKEVAAAEAEAAEVVPEVAEASEEAVEVVLEAQDQKAKKKLNHQENKNESICDKQQAS